MNVVELAEKVIVKICTAPKILVLFQLSLNIPGTTCGAIDGRIPELCMVEHLSDIS